MALNIKESEIKVINLDPSAEDAPILGVDLSTRLQKTLLKLKGKYIRNDGKSVDYEAMRKSSEFEEYKKDACDLQRVDLSAMDEKEKKVFFLNVYNALTIHGLQEQKTLPDSVLSVQHFFKTTAYMIGGYVYTLDDIEHGILRCNGSHPACTKPQLPMGDPRTKFMCQKLDPRIHFALVCGAKSCPAIGVYTVENIDKALDMATRSFISQEVEMQNLRDEVHLSRLFQWYREDFGETEVALLKWIKPYLSQSEQDRCSILLLKLDKFGPVALQYKEYDWSINKS